MNRTDTIVLAALDNGQHVQVGKARTQDDAASLYDRLDGSLTGYGRGERGEYRIVRQGRPHFIGGHAVKFYRMRQGAHEFGTVASYPVSAVRTTPTTTQEVPTMKSARKSAKVARTRGGIARPKVGTLRTWDAARTAAREANVARGRGYRALRAADGGYEVIFRPAVAANKQRRVRALGTDF